MYKKATRTVTFLAAAALLVASCSSVDLSPTDRYDMAYAFKDLDNAELYLNYFYKEVWQFGAYGSCALGGSNSNLSDGLTDILKYGAIVAGTGDCNLIMTVDGQQNVSRNYFDSWTTCYGWIRRINEYLGGLKKYRGTFSQEDGDRLEAEARLFRAWSYFLIMRCHASSKDDLGAILYEDINDMNAAGKNRARASLAASWDFIQTDVDFAAARLPEPSAARGRLHRYAALALKARAMLYAGRYDLAADAVGIIKSSGLYGFEDGREPIWSSEFKAREYTHLFDSKYSQPGDVCLSGSYGGGLAGPTQEFVDMYDNADGTPFNPSDASRRFITPENVGSRDPRLQRDILYNRAVWKGRALECFEGGVDQKYMPYGEINSPGNTVTGYYMRKLLDESNRDFVADGSYQSWTEFRYSEMILILAECLAHEGKFPEARTEVAALRKARFGGEVYTASVNSWDSALDLILKERAIELCFEGHRFWDLRRTGRAASVLDGRKYTGVYWHRNADGSFRAESISCDLSPRRYPERFDRFPIPQTEISNNTIAAQNSDW